MRILTRATVGRQQATTRTMVTQMLIAPTAGSSCVESLVIRAMVAVSAFTTRVTTKIDVKVAETATTTMTVGAIITIIVITTAKIVAMVAATAATSLSIKISEALVAMGKQAKVATITEVITEVAEIISASKAVNMTSLTKTKSTPSPTTVCTIRMIPHSSASALTKRQKAPTSSRFIYSNQRVSATQKTSLRLTSARRK